MALDDLKDIETRAAFNALDGVDQDKYDEIKSCMEDKACMYTVHQSRGYCKTLLDVNFDFGPDFILIEDDAVTRIIINPAKHGDIEQEFFDNGDIFYGDWSEYYEIKARLDAE